MLDEFKIALLKGNNADGVARNLIEQVRAEAKEREKRIEQDRRRAEFIEAGLHEEPGTEPRIIAEGFLKQYELETGVQITANYHSPRTLKKELEERKA